MVDVHTETKMAQGAVLQTERGRNVPEPGAFPDGLRYDAAVLTTLAILEVIYLIALSIWILLEKRAPVATIAWILALALLPGIGFVVYYLLGPRRIHRTRSRRARAYDRLRSSLPDLRTLDAATQDLLRQPELRQLMRLSLTNSAAAVSADNEVTVLRNGAQKFPALEKAIREAKHHVHLEYYIFEADETGRTLLELLTERAREGVKVRLLVDAVGSLDLTHKLLDPLLLAGGEYAVFNKVKLIKRVPALNFRNHRKIVVVDGRIGFTGGLNIGNEYRDVDEEGGYRDTHLRLEGPAVRGLQSIFLEDWFFATGNNVAEPHCFHAPAVGDQLVQIIRSGPDMDWQAIHHAYFTAITSARTKLHLTTPYFVPDEALNTALVTAAMRGVDVKLLVPRQSDSRVVTWAARSFYDELLKAGVRIFEYLPTMLHAKTMSVDGVLGVVGTANLDPRSFHLNWEIIAVTYGPSTAEELDRLFAQDLAASEEVTLDMVQARSFPQRLLEAGSRVLSPVL